MTKEDIGNILKQLRISSGMTQKEVAKKLGRTQQIIGYWETGYSQPDANTLFVLCDIYGTTVDSAFGFDRNTPVLSKEDAEFINKYECLDESGKKKFNNLLDLELERIEREKELSNEIASMKFENERLRRMTTYSYMHNIA